MGSELRDVVITGVGPVTAIGVGRDALWSALSAGASILSDRSLATDLVVSSDFLIASMPDASQVPGLSKHMDFLATQDCPGYRDLAYAILAAQLALTDAGIEYDPRGNDIGAVQVFEAPGVEQTVARLFAMFATPPTDGPPPVYDLLAPSFYNSQPFLYVHLLGKALGLHGFSTSVHNACTSGAFAIEIAADRIRTGRADVMVVTGGEGFDTAVRLEWFKRLDLYAHDERMRPFDSESTGFYVGEGAGAIVLESAAHAEARNAAVYAAYLGGAFAHQGWKQTIPDVRAARLRGLIESVLKNTGVGPSEIDLVVPHGAATSLSDRYEARCLKEALGGSAGNAVATAFKPYFGHMLAASGIIDTICAMLAIEHQSVPATLHTRPEHALLPIPLVTTQTDRPISTLLKLSTGFTGHDAAAVFRTTS